MSNIIGTFSSKSITQKLDDLKQKGKVEIESKESMILTISQLSTLNLKNTPLKTRLDARFPFQDNQTLMFYSPVYHSDKKDEKGEALKVYLITLINPHVIY